MLKFIFLCKLIGLCVGYIKNIRIFAKQLITNTYIMKFLTYIIIFIVVVKIVSTMIYSFVSTFVTSDVVFWGAIVIASILAFTGIRQDMKKNIENN